MAIRSPAVTLRSFSVERYRSLRRTSFSPHHDLSVLIGPNGSGKTNILRAIQLLSESARPRHRPEPTSLLARRVRVTAEFVVGKKSVPFREIFLFAPSDRDEEEVTATSEEWNLKAFNGKDIWQAVPRPIFDPRFRGYYYVSTGSGRQALRRNTGHSLGILGPAERALRSIALFRSSIKYYSASQFTNPSKCPSSFEIEDDNRVVETFSDRGPHLSFISGLYQTYKNNRDLYLSYLGIVGPSGIGLIDSIDWKPIILSTSSVDVKTGGKIVRRKKKRILIVPTVSLRRLRLSFNQLSEGTFRTLALLFYLVTDESKLLLVEEPEVCVHHGLLSSVIESIKAYSVHKQVVISTHSELVLDSVAPEHVFAVTNQAVRGTVIRPLSRAMSSRDYSAMKDYLATSGSLGEFWTHGGIGTE